MDDATVDAKLEDIKNRIVSAMNQLDLNITISIGITEYKDGLTIDRIDVNGCYEPSNCRWVTLKEQQRNRRNNKIVNYKGKNVCLSFVSETEKINWSTINNRMKRGLSLENSIRFGNKIYRGKEIFCETNGKTYSNASEFLKDVGLKKGGWIYDFLNGKSKSDNFHGYKIKRIFNKEEKNDNK